MSFKSRFARFGRILPALAAVLPRGGAGEGAEGPRGAGLCRGYASHAAPGSMSHTVRPTELARPARTTFCGTFGLRPHVPQNVASESRPRRLARAGARGRGAPPVAGAATYVIEIDNIGLSGKGRAAPGGAPRPATPPGPAGGAARRAARSRRARPAGPRPRRARRGRPTPRRAGGLRTREGQSLPGRKPQGQPPLRYKKGRFAKVQVDRYFWEA